MTDRTISEAAATQSPVSELQFPLDLENYDHTRDANELLPGDVVIYTGKSIRGRRYVPESKRSWLLRVTRTEGQNVYGSNIYSREGWDADEEFVIVDGQVKHHGVYVISRAFTAGDSAASSPDSSSDVE